MRPHRIVLLLALLVALVLVGHRCGSVVGEHVVISSTVAGALGQ